MFGKNWEMIKRGLAVALSASLLAGTMTVSASLPTAAASGSRVETDAKGGVTINLDGREVWQAASAAMQKADAVTGDIADRIMAQTGSNGNPVVLEDDIYEMELPENALRGLPAGLSMDMYISAGAEDAAEDYTAAEEEEAAAVTAEVSSASDLAHTATGVAERPVRDFFASNMFSLVRENDDSAPAGTAAAAGGEGYELNGSEHIYFVLSNATDQDVNYTIKMGGMELLKTKVLKSHGNTEGVIGATVSSLIGIPASTSNMTRATGSDMATASGLMGEAELTDDVVAKVVRTTLKNFFVIYRSEETDLGTKVMVVTTADTKFKAEGGGLLSGRTEKPVLHVEDVPKGTKKYEDAEKALRDNDVDHADFAAVDISFRKTAGGTEDYEPYEGQIVNVRIETRAVADFNPDSVSIQHHLEDGTLETVAGTTRKTEQTFIEINDDAADGAVSGTTTVSEDNQTEVTLESDNDGNVYTFDEDANRALMQKQLDRAKSKSSFRMSVGSGETRLENDTESETGAPKKTTSAKTAAKTANNTSTATTVSSNVDANGIKTEVKEEKGKGGLRVEDGRVVADFVVDSFSIYTITGEMNPETKEMVFSGSIEGVSVNVTAPAGAFKIGTIMKVIPVYDEDIISSIADFAETDTERIRAMDISFSFEGEDIEPSIPVKVILTAKELNEESLIVHMDDEGTPNLVDGSVSKERAVFESDAFSVYAIVDASGETIVTPRVRYHFLGKSGESTAEPTQIIKNLETVSPVTTPAPDENQVFVGWYIWDSSANTWGEKFLFDTPVRVNCGSQDVVTAANVIVGAPDNIIDVYLRPQYSSRFATVYYMKDNIGSNAGINSETVFTTLKVGIEDGQNSVLYAIPDIDDETFKSPSSSNSAYIFVGWSRTAPGGNNSYNPNDNRTVISEIELTDGISQRLYPVYRRAHWMRFRTAPVGSGATYVSPVFIDNGTLASTKIPSDPKWKGHKFLYWTLTPTYNEETGEIYELVGENAPEEFNFDQTLSEDIKLYAYWDPDYTTYTVIYWKQVISDLAGTNPEERHYEFAEQKTYEDVKAGTIVNPTDEDISKAGTGDYVGFHHKTEQEGTVNVDSKDVVVAAGGSTILNVYYDRDVVSMKFYRGNSNDPGYNNAIWNETENTYQSTTGADVLPQYARIDGKYYPLVRNTVYNYRLQYTYSVTTANGFNRYGVVDGEYVALTPHYDWFSFDYYTYGGNNGPRYNGDTIYTRSNNNSGAYNYSGTVYEKTDDGFEEFTGEDKGLKELYGKDSHGNYVMLQRNTAYTWTYIDDNGETQRYTNTPRYYATYAVFNGLYGQTWQQAGYGGWPDGTWSYYNNENGTTGMSFLGQFVLPDGVRNPSGHEIRLYYSGSYSATYYFYLQGTNGEYPELDAPSDIGYGNGGTFTFSEKYEGFKVSTYRTSTGNRWISAKNADGSFASVTNYNNRLYIRYEREQFALEFLDPVDSSLIPVTLSNNETVLSKELYYETELQNYYPSANNAPVSTIDGYEFNGRWFADAGQKTQIFFHEPQYDRDGKEITPSLTEEETKKLWYYIDKSNEKIYCNYIPSEAQQQMSFSAGDDREYHQDAYTILTKMPMHDLPVYAGWSKIWYWIKIDPDGGVLNHNDPELSIDSTWFWEASHSGDTVDQYVTSRDYVEDPDGTYYYHYDEFDPETETNQFGTNSRKAYYSTDPTNAYDSRKYRPAEEEEKYILVGWYEVDQDTGSLTPYDFDSMITHDLILRAVWTQVGSYKVRYDLSKVFNTNGIEEPNLSVSADWEHKYDEFNYAANANAMVKEDASGLQLNKLDQEDETNYVFLGWYVNNTVVGLNDLFSIIPNEAVSIDDSILHDTIVLYPVYGNAEEEISDASKTALILNANGGTTTLTTTTDYTVNDEQTTVSYTEKQINESITLPEASVFEKEDCELIGWAFNPNAKVPVFVPEQIVGIDNLTGHGYNGDETNTLYAVWHLDRVPVKIFKYETKNSGQAGLAGAGFNITGPNSINVSEESGADGYTAEINLPTPVNANDDANEFTLTEATVPTNYEGLSGTITITVDYYGTVKTRKGSSGAFVELEEDTDGVFIIPVENTRKKADVLVKKTLSDPFITGEKDFTFTVKVKDGDADITREILGTTTITVRSASEGYTISQLPVGSTLTITENDAENYTTTVNGTEKADKKAEITVPEEGSTITFVNTRNTKKLTVKKLVAGNMGNKAATFTITLALPGEGIDTIDGLPKNTTSGTWSINLGHDESKEIILPAGVHYTLNEYMVGLTGYTVKFNDTEGAEYSGQLTEDTSITVTNTRNVAVPTGITTDLHFWKWLIGACFLALIGAAMYGRKKRRM